MLRWKPAQNARLLICKLHLRHVTGKATSHSTRRTHNTRQVAGYDEVSRLGEQMQAALPAPDGFTMPCQSGYFLADFRLA
jgi:hypothetical protein